jgi:HK97 family phage major capsid protein
MENPVVQMNMEELKTLLMGAIGEQIKAAGLDKVDRAHGVFPGVEDVKNMTKTDRIKAWLRSIVMKNPSAEDLAIAKAINTEATTVGLGFVPDEFRTEVIRVAENFGIVRRLCSVFPTDAPSVNLHQANGVITVAWVSEGNAFSESNPTFTEPEITIGKMGAISVLSNELFKDSKFPIVQYIAELYGEALAGEEDKQALIGTGSPFHGLVGGTITGLVAATADSAASYKNFSPDDVLNLAMGVAEKYRNGGAYFMHPTVLAALALSFKAAGSGDYLLTRPTEKGLATSIWGYPVYTSEKLPSSDAASTKYIGFANPKRCYMFDNQAMELMATNVGVVGSNNLFEKDLQAIRVTERIGIGWTLGAGCTTLATHA